MKIDKYNVSAAGMMLSHFEPSGVAKAEPDEAQIDVAARWIDLHCRPRKTTNRMTFSYGLKHRVEQRAARTGKPQYVSNGAFIVAAIRRGYKLKSEGINATFNMSIIREVATNE